MSIEKLSTNASLKDVMDKFEEISLVDFSNIDIITATELPSEGKEGQICIITEDIPSNIYVSNNPPALQETDILIKTKENGFQDITLKSSNKYIKLTLDLVTQIKNGEPTVLEAYIRKNQNWEPFTPSKVMLFEAGTGDITKITGGYSKYLNSNAIFNLAEDMIHLRTYGDSDETVRHVRAVTNNTIDVTNYSKLVADIHYTREVNVSIGYSNGYLGLSSSSENNDKYDVSIDIKKTSRHQATIDISELKGEYRFKSSVKTKNTLQGYSSLKIYNVWLEK